MNYVNIKKWTSNTKYVDHHTGELIEKKDLYKYKKLKTNKQTTIYETEQRGHTEYTIELEPQQHQGKLF